MRSLNRIPTNKEVFFWNILGSFTNALLSVVLLMLVTRFLNDKQSDIFSIAWTISQLMATVGTFQIRTYQATDVTGVFCFREYFIFRLITICLMMISSWAYILERGYEGEKALVVFLMCLFRAIDSLEDVYEGWFQQKERLDLAGKALTYRIVLSVIGFGMVLHVTQNLVLACVILIFVYFICFFMFDIRYQRDVHVLKDISVSGKKDHVKWLVSITLEGLPLFINAFLMMSITNAPKMVLDVSIEQGEFEQGVQTIYNIIFMPASFLNLAYIVFRPLITQMAIVWNLGKNKRFLLILSKIVICLFGFGILLVVGSAVLGIPILSFVYGIDLVLYKKELLILIIGGCIYTFAVVLDNALVVIRMQYILVLAYGITYIFIKIASEHLVPLCGVMGAAMSYATAMMVFLFVVMIMFAFSFFIAVKKRNKKIKEE